MIYPPYWKEQIALADAAYAGDNGMIEKRLLWRDKYIAGLESQLEKWETWKPDDETLEALQDQARARDGSYTNGLAAQSAYISGLEGRVRDLEQRLKLAEMVIRTFVPINIEQKQALTDYTNVFAGQNASGGGDGRHK